jgi:hypothetical protein
MRRSFTQAAVLPAAVDQPWLPGLPHAAAALATWFVFGTQACITGLLMATMASFVVYLPLIALALNGGKPLPENDPAPPLTTSQRLLLLALWTLTAWGVAAVS